MKVCAEGAVPLAAAGLQLYRLAAGLEVGVVAYPDLKCCSSKEKQQQRHTCKNQCGVRLYWGEGSKASCFLLFSPSALSLS